MRITPPGEVERTFAAHYADVRSRLRNPTPRKRPDEPIPEPDARSFLEQEKNAERDLYALMASALAEAQPLPQPKLLLRDDPITERRTCRYIFEHVAAFYGVTVMDLASQRRHARLAWVRHIAMYLARRLTLRSLPEIGGFLGGKDHTSVMHGARKIEEQLAFNEDLVAEVAELVRRIEAGEPVAVGDAKTVSPPKSAPKKKYLDWNEGAQNDLRRMWFDDVSVREIAHHFGRHTRTIQERAALMGLPRRHTPDWRRALEEPFTA